jgi:hypothetical protein
MSCMGFDRGPTPEEMLDRAPDDLLKRLREGKVYYPGGARFAFFLPVVDPAALLERSLQ